MYRYNVSILFGTLKLCIDIYALTREFFLEKCIDIALKIEMYRYIDDVSKYLGDTRLLSCPYMRCSGTRALQEIPAMTVFGH